LGDLDEFSARASTADGMPVKCVLAIDNTLSAEKAFLTEKITTLGRRNWPRSAQHWSPRQKANELMRGS
jgi:hypothetical protein